MGGQFAGLEVEQKWTGREQRGAEEQGGSSTNPLHSFILILLRIKSLTALYCL